MAETRPALVLRGGNVFDSAARTFRAGVDVVCLDGRIAGLGTGAPGPDGATVIDCAGTFLVPGLIDCHVHLTFGGSADMAGDVGAPVPVQAWRAAENAKKTLQAGVTTVRDLGAPGHLNVHLARAIGTGLVEGPKMLAAGMGVTMTGGHGHTSIAREADGVDEVRKAVREQLRAGATAIKLFASGGVMTPGVDPRSPSFTEEEMRAGVEEAHKAFRVVGAHAQAAEGIKNAVRAGVDSVEHGIWLDEEAIGLMRERGTHLVPTLSAPYNINRGGSDAGIPAYAVEKNAGVLHDHFESYRAALQGGVRVAMGTDQGTPLNRPGENGQEVVRMAEGGLTPAAAILAATQWAAELLGVGDDRGRLTEGLAADLVVLRRDPIETIEAIATPEEIAWVVKDGRIVKKEKQA